MARRGFVVDVADERRIDEILRDPSIERVRVTIGKM